MTTKQNIKQTPTIVSLFTGVGGIDLGFEMVGFNVIWANEFDKKIIPTLKKNFPNTIIDERNVVEINADEIPDCDGIIGGQPCQSWSEAGTGRGINDKRGQLFYEYIRILKAKQPKFFVVENVSGILQEKHSKAFNNFMKEFEECGYNVAYKLMNANDYNVPQTRERVIIIGIRKDLDKMFTYPSPQQYRPTLKDAIWGMPEPLPGLTHNKANPSNKLTISNHEYFIGGFSSMFMSRNRVRSWNEPSFTIQASGRHAPLHPKAPKMVLVAENQRMFEPGHETDYRRLSVRECARIQTFPDWFEFIYNDINDGYKMIGNAVPVNLAYAIASEIKKQIV